MTDTNRITGPGYYPRRPSPPAPKGHTFAGSPYIIRLLAPNGSWDSVNWCGSGTYSARCMLRRSTLVGFEVEDGNGVLLYSHRFPKPIVLDLGNACTITLDNPTPRLRDPYVGGTWTVPPAF